MTFTILGPPATKKTSQRIVRVRGRMLVVPSTRTKGWERSAVLQLQSQLPNMRLAPFGYPVNCRALIYRDRLVGDAVNYYQAIADALQAAGAVENDRLIVSWDGSRLLLDRKRPRVEIELTVAVELGAR